MITAALLILGLTIDQAAAQAYCKQAYSDVVVVGFTQTYSPLKIEDVCSLSSYPTGLVPGCLVNNLQRGNVLLHATCVQGSANATCQFSGNPSGSYLRYQGTNAGFVKETIQSTFGTECQAIIGSHTVPGSTLSFATVSFPAGSVLNGGLTLLAACYSQETYALPTWPATAPKRNAYKYKLQRLLVGGASKTWQITPSFVGVDSTLSSFDAASVSATVSSRYTTNANIGSIVASIPNSTNIGACSSAIATQGSLPLGKCTASDFCSVF